MSCLSKAEWKNIKILKLGMLQYMQTKYFWAIEAVVGLTE